LWASGKVPSLRDSLAPSVEPSTDVLGYRNDAASRLILGNN